MGNGRVRFVMYSLVVTSLASAVVVFARPCSYGPASVRRLAETIPSPDVQMS
jgi:hypothetical protein